MWAKGEEEEEEEGCGWWKGGRKQEGGEGASFCDHSRKYQKLLRSRPCVKTDGKRHDGQWMNTLLEEVWFSSYMQPADKVLIHVTSTLVLCPLKYFSGLKQISEFVAKWNVNYKICISITCFNINIFKRAWRYYVFNRAPVSLTPQHKHCPQQEEEQQHQHVSVKPVSLCGILCF